MARSGSSPGDATQALLNHLESRLEAYLDDLRELVSIDSYSCDKEGVDAVNDWLEARLTALGAQVTRHPQAAYGDDLVAVLLPSARSDPGGSSGPLGVRHNSAQALPRRSPQAPRHSSGDDPSTGSGQAVDLSREEGSGHHRDQACPGPGAGGRILLLGHSDTVFPRGTAAERPLSIDGDRIHGPGTCDMKAGLLTGIYALEALRHIGFDEFERITYLCVSDEEIDDRHSIELIREQARRHDAVLTLEAARANGDIVSARKAVCWYEIEAFGRAAHAGVEPEKGRSATLALIRLLLALDGLNGLRPGVTVNIGCIEGGRLPNIVADHARARIDLRAVTNEDMDALRREVERLADQSYVPDVKMTARLMGGVCPAMERTPAVVELENMARVAARELGFEVRGAATGGGSDGSFAAAEGIPTLDGLGPIGGLDHSPDEYIELNSIVPRTALLAKLIMAIAEKERRQE